MKRIFLCIFAFFVVTSLFAQQPRTEQSSPLVQTYNIGDYGPGGGRIFSLSPRMEFIDLNIKCGYINAIELLRFLRITDWRLPDISELEKIYNNENSIRGIIYRERFWAYRPFRRVGPGELPREAVYALTLDFSDGSVAEVYTENDNRVLVVREF